MTTRTPLRLLMPLHIPALVSADPCPADRAFSPSSRSVARHNVVPDSLYLRRAEGTVAAENRFKMRLCM